MIFGLCLAACIACLLGSPARAESRVGEETGPSPPPGASVSSSLGSPKALGPVAIQAVPVDLPLPESIRFQGHWGDAAARTRFEAFSLGDWQRVLPVVVLPTAEAEGLERPPMAGRYRVVEGAVLFTPSFGFERGVRYWAGYRPVALRSRLSRLGQASSECVPAVSPLVFQIRRLERGKATTVSAIFPSVAAVPENLLKFYLQFSQPMTQGTHYRHLRLLRGDDSEVRLPFLRLDEELWNPAGDRLTVFIDPGRIKSGLLPREEVGPALEAGKEYRLVVDAAWEDVDGYPLGESFEKQFRVVKPDLERPTLPTWQLELPPAGTRDPLVVRFPEPLDRALLQRVVWVAESEGGEVAGTIQTAEEERIWKLLPSQPWQPGLYALCAENTLEDLAGNSLGRPFEIDVFDTVSKRVERKTLRRGFQIR